MDEQSIFLEALEIDNVEDRIAWIDKKCGRDNGLKQQLLKMLDNHENAKSFLEHPPSCLHATELHQNESNSESVLSRQQFESDFDGELSIAFSRINQSVLGLFKHSLGSVPRVTLRDSSGELESPITSPSSAEIPIQSTQSRYRLDGEIARGGMGAIIKGRDMDLGRELAIKVLLDSHKNQPDMISRFIEEAQIGGQLQHPGIAPIHELGQFSDQRPYFTMKLVKGNTLAKLLAERNSSAEERAKFIGIFEDICQTMAYAHSRGVIHRDLKPANIMVGAFGEVQVMDWGLAKVLSFGGVADEKKSRHKHTGKSVIRTNRTSAEEYTSCSLGSNTRMGSVMGTPAYMAPEQALGDINQLDQRADVFGLGAILTEILTGQPPYSDEDSTKVYQLACEGNLADCFSRLDACEADKDLVAFTKTCLSPELNHRPKDAKVLADQVATYIDSVETKLREAEKEKAAQEALLVEKHKRNRLVVALAGMMALILTLGVVGWLWFTDLRTRNLQAVKEKKQATILKEKEQKLRIETLPKVKRLLKSNALAEAYKLVAAAREDFPNDERLKEYWADVSSLWMVQTDPQGARIYLKPYGDSKADWGKPIGVTPLTVNVAKLSYHWRIELEGFEPIEGCADTRDVSITRSLEQEGRILPGMVRVLGSEIGNIGEDFS